MVYDLTELIPNHSGSAEVLIPLCGKDATGAFADKGGRGRPHSERAKGILAGYQIGRLNESKTATEPAGRSSGPQRQVVGKDA